SACPRTIEGNHETRRRVSGCRTRSEFHLHRRIAAAYRIYCRHPPLEHLMYKALIELSADRAEFLSRLFARQRPENIGPESTPEELFKAFRNVPAELDLFFANLDAIKIQLKERHRFKLSAEDEASIQYIFRAFYVGGPNLTYVGPVTPRYAVRNRM